jgi:hypothetical protein
MEMDSRSGWQGKGTLEELMRERVRATIESIIDEELEVRTGRGTIATGGPGSSWLSARQTHRYWLRQHPTETGGLITPCRVTMCPGQGNRGDLADNDFPKPASTPSVDQEQEPPGTRQAYDERCVISLIAGEFEFGPLRHPVRLF